MKGIVIAVVTLAILSNLTSCIAWSTNPQGQLQSIGVPGVPVWQSHTLVEQKRLASEGSLAAAPGSVVDPAAAKLISVDSDAPWLAELNRWRNAAGVQPVGENVGVSLGSTQHARYLVENGPKDTSAFLEYARTIGAAGHREERGNPYWTQDGSEAARGDISCERNPEADVDGLLIAPFHRLPLLAPWAKVAGYDDYGRWPRRSAVLLVRGSTPVGMAKAVLFPPDGTTMPTEAMVNSEFPNPLMACPGYSFPVGLPITVQLGASVLVRLESFSIQDKTAGHQVEACGFDAQSYPDEYGRRALLGYGAIVLVPLHPLVSGHEYSERDNRSGSLLLEFFRVEKRRTFISRSGALAARIPVLFQLISVAAPRYR
jgi:hypothetical protein